MSSEIYQNCEKYLQKKTIDTTELNEFLIKQLKDRIEKSYEDDPTAHAKFGSHPWGRITTEIIGVWVWIKSDVTYRGTKWDFTTDRSTGDPFADQILRNWIGLVESVSEKVSCPEELDEWALIKTVWTSHNNITKGRRVEELTKDGKVKIRFDPPRFDAPIEYEHDDLAI